MPKKKRTMLACEAELQIKQQWMAPSVFEASVRISPILITPVDSEYVLHFQHHSVTFSLDEAPGTEIL
jgi:hypothetical protein